MPTQQKKISDYTDRELLERIAINSKASADAAQWTKNYLVVTSIVGLILMLIALFR